MKKLFAMFSLLIVTAALGCAQNSSNNSGPTPADSNTLKAIEQEAAGDGVNIRHDSAYSYSDKYSGNVYPLTISWGGVGYTDDEMKTAVQVLRKYYAAVTVATSFTTQMTYESDRAQQLDVINDALTSIQGKRNDILTKKICGGDHADDHSH